MNADGRRGELIEHADEPPRRDVRADLPPGAPCQSVAFETPLVQHRAVRTFHRAGHLDRHHLAVLLEHPAALLVRARAERKTVVLRKVGKAMRGAAPAQIGRRRHAHAPVLAELERHERRIRQFAEPHGAIKPLVDEVDQPVRQIQRNGNIRVRDGESRHQRRDVPTPEPGRRGKPQMAARLHAARRHARLGIVHVVKNALTVFEKRRAFERQRDLAGGTHQQFDAEALLERVDTAADDRRRHAFGERRRRQTAFCGDGNEGLDLLETVHGRSARSAAKLAGARQIRCMKVKDQVIFSPFFSA